MSEWERTLIREASYTRFPKGCPDPRMQADERATIDSATFMLQSSSQVLLVLPTHMFSGSEPQRQERVHWGGTNLRATMQSMAC